MCRIFNKACHIGSNIPLKLLISQTVVTNFYQIATQQSELKHIREAADDEDNAATVLNTIQDEET